MTTMPSAAVPSGGFKWMYLSLQGRATRSNWWLWGVVGLIIANMILGTIAYFIDAALGLQFGVLPIGPLTILASVVLIYPGICVSGKRWHDRNKSAWWILLVYAPMIAQYVFMAIAPDIASIIGIVFLIGAIWTLVECGFLRGTVGDNRFGPDPLGGN
jgi:uncharacterized membrane protein YhaH (DUF805 family)